MSISLSNHESRISALEKAGYVTESKYTNPGHIKFSSGVIINFGDTNGAIATNFCPQTFSKPFTSKCICSVASPTRDMGNWAGEECRSFLTSLSTIKVGAYGVSGSIYVSWIAIGILYTYRYIIKSLLIFTPLSYLFNKEV